MSTKPESQFITSIHKHLDSNIYRMKNNNPYVGGIPDCYYSGFEADLWIEYKYKKIDIPRAQVVPDLSKLQQRWIKGRQEEGREVWVILGTKTGGVIYKRYDDMVDGITPLAYLENIMTRKQLAETIAAYTGVPNGNH